MSGDLTLITCAHIHGHCYAAGWCSGRGTRLAASGHAYFNTKEAQAKQRRPALSEKKYEYVVTTYKLEVPRLDLQ